jgi:hypothetical protein
MSNIAKIVISNRISSVAVFSVRYVKAAAQSPTALNGKSADVAADSPTATVDLVAATAGLAIDPQLEADAANPGPSTSITASTTSTQGGSHQSPEVSGMSGVLDNLNCSVCATIFLDCVSIWPCLHSFCGSCLSQWAKGSKVSKRFVKGQLNSNFTPSFLESVHLSKSE